jgi:predicted ArsR family transcriptional regulator
VDELAAVGNPELREALRFVRAQELGVTADDLAAARDVHRNVARARLERLVEAGLLMAHYERRSGRSGPGAGRPAKVYSAAPSLASIEFPRRRYETLVGLLADAIAPAERAERLHEIGVRFGHELADAAALRTTTSLRVALGRLCAALRQLGYQASLERLDDGIATIATPTCPLRPLVRARPEVAGIDRGMWVGLTSRALAGAEPLRLSCETRDCLAAHAPCQVTLSFGSLDSKSRNAV